MNKFREWVLLLHDDPERWLLSSTGMGTLLFFVLSWFVPHNFVPLLAGAGLLCAAIFWLFMILGMAGWP